MNKINLKVSVIGLAISFLLTTLLVTSNFYVKNFKSSFFAVDLGLITDHIIKNYFILDVSDSFFLNSLEIYSEWLYSKNPLNDYEEFSEKLNKLDKDILVEIKGKNIILITDKINDSVNLTNLINKNIVSELEYFLNFEFIPFVNENISILEEYSINEYQFDSFKNINLTLENLPTASEIRLNEIENLSRYLNLLSLYEYVSKKKIIFNDFDIKNIKNAITQIHYFSATNIFLQFLFILLISYLLFIIIFFKSFFKKN